MKIGTRYLLIILGMAIAVVFLAELVLSLYLSTMNTSVRSLEASKVAHRLMTLVRDRVQTTAEVADSLATRLFHKKETAITSETLDSLGLDLLVLSDNLGNDFWSVHRTARISSTSSTGDGVSFLLGLPLREPSTNGLFQFGTDAAIATVRTVRYTSEAGEFSGRLLLVRVLDKSRLSQMAAIAGANINVRRVPIVPVTPQASRPLSSHELLEEMTIGKEFLDGIIPGERFEIGYQFASPPTRSLEEFSIISLFLLPVLAIILVTTSFVALKRLILRTVDEITDQVVNLIDQPHPSLIVEAHPDDSFGRLVTQLNQLLERFNHSRESAAHATRLAQRAIDTKTDFILSISYDVRSPLNAILGIAQIMERMSLPVHLREYIHVIKESGNTLLGLITDMLDFSSLEAGKVTFVKGPFNIQELLTNVVLSHASAAFKKNVEVIIDISSSAPTHVEGDRLRVKQILNTLVSNAITFTDVAEVIVSLGGKSEKGDTDGRVRISVKDSGIGISPEREPYIFESFNNPEPGSQKRLGQTGLSLPIARRLALGMGGDLWVENRYGHGATFHLEISSTAVSLREDTEMSLDYTSEVLIADFHSLSGTNLGHMLLDLGFSRVSQTTEEDLNQRLKKPGSTPLLVFTDIRVLSEETINTLHELRGAGHISWYALVPPHLSVGSERFIAAGATNVIPKPVSRANLTEYLAQPALRPETLSDDNSPPPPTRVRSSAGLSILVVDDIESNRFILETMLKSWGHQVIAASSGVEAINKLEEHGHFDADAEGNLFDLVFMDIQMPQINGLEATRIIRASEQLGTRKQPVPIIAVTADAQVKDINEYVCVGMWGAITKPILALRLFGIIESLGLRDNQPIIAQASHQRILPADADFIAALERRDINFSVSRLWNDLGHDVGLLSNILHTFIDETDRQMNNMLTLLQRGGFADISALAHALRGAFLNLGALGCAQTAARLESSAQERDLKGVTENAEQLQHSTGVLLESIRSAVATHQLSSQTTPPL